jgi:hypothetical protein
MAHFIPGCRIGITTDTYQASISVYQYRCHAIPLCDSERSLKKLFLGEESRWSKINPAPTVLRLHSREIASDRRGSNGNSCKAP